MKEQKRKEEVNKQDDPQINDFWKTEWTFI